MQNEIIMYLYISSEQSDNYFTDNTSTRFRVRLPKRLNLDPRGGWHMAVLDLDLPRLQEGYKTAYLTINSRVCEPSFVNTALTPTLNRVYFNDVHRGCPVTFDSPRYVKVTTDVLDVLDIYLTDSKGATPSFKTGTVSCTLHLHQEQA